MEWPGGARAILHVDMDAFYASVEVHDDPSLRGKAVIVGGPKEARGVVSAASYEARAYDVHSAMPLRVAARLCPGGVFLPVRMERYLAVSRTVFGILGRFTPLVEPLSVDEAFLDLGGSERLLGGPVAAARAIRAAIRAETGLTASVGVAPNKFIAKIASDLRKPDALVIVPPDAVRAFLAPLPVERMWGVGPRGAEALRRLGITTFGELVEAGVARLRPLFHAHAEGLLALARGEDVRPVLTERAPKSIGRETTFPEDVPDRETVRSTLVALLDHVATRLRREGLRARCLTLKVRFAPFRTVTRRRTLAAPTDATDPLLKGALALWEGVRDATPVRLVGISASAFSGQLALPTEEESPRQQALDRAVDRVREKYGAASLRRGSVIQSDGS